jgi:hypothetical protein
MLSVCVGYAGSVIATVDSQEVVKGNSVTLSIKAMGGNAVFPAINKIGNVRIENTSTSSERSVSFINGSVNNESSTTTIFTFTPKENMIIPAYEVKIEGKGHMGQKMS